MCVPFVMVRPLEGGPDSVMHLQACRVETSKQYEELSDDRLESTINKQEAETVVKVALLCTNSSPTMRPSMVEVVNMLDGNTCVPEIVPERLNNSEDLRFKVIRDFQSDMTSKGSQTGGQTQNSNTNRTETYYSLTSDDGAFEIRSVDT
ncbi:putative non-specific serine/threonine protein kinase [Helianthus anomalus]